MCLTRRRMSRSRASCVGMERRFVRVGGAAGPEGDRC